MKISTDLSFEPTDEMGTYILTNESTEFEILQYVHNYKEWLKRIGYISDKPFTKWQGHHYCDLILSGTIPSASTVYAAAERFKYDLTQQNTEHFMYTWDESKAETFNRYAEGEIKVANSEGEVTELVYSSAQHFYLGNLFGWSDYNGDRRFKYGFYLVGRSQGKTTEKWPIAYLMMQERGKKNVNIMFFAGTETQSEDLFNEAKFVVENSSAKVRNWFKPMNKEIKVDRQGYKSNMKLASSVATSSHGKALSLVLVDEVHTFKPAMRETVKTLQQAMVKRKGSMILFSSTRSQGTSDYLEDMVSDGVFALEMYKTDSSVNNKFYFLAQIEDVRDIYNFNNWIKANPQIHLLDLPAMIAQFKSHRRKIEEERMDSDVIDWLTQHFNFRDTSLSKAYVYTSVLKKNQKMVDLAEYKGKDAFMGIDLGGGGDFTSVVTVIPEIKDGVKRLVTEHKSFLTDTAYNAKLHDPVGHYPDIGDWLANDYLRLMPDTERNGEVVYQYILEQINKYNIKKIAYDRAGFFDHVGTRLIEDGYEHLLYEVNQTGRVVSEPLRSLYEDFFVLGNVIYNRDPLMTFFIRNAQLNKSSGGLWTIGKPTTGKTPSAKANIDGLAALQDAHAAIMQSGIFVELNPKIKRRGRVRVSNYRMLQRMREEVI